MPTSTIRKASRRNALRQLGIGIASVAGLQIGANLTSAAPIGPMAARSGVQNIAEGSRASGTSKKTELKLTNVARASLEELRLDYEDYLRQRGLEQL